MLSKHRNVRDRAWTARYSNSMSKRASNVRRVVGTALVALSIVFIVRALHFFTFRPDVLGKYFRFKWVIMGHIAGGILALVAGPFQLSKRFRNANRRAHRVLGRVYVGGVGIGAICALVLASTTAWPVSWHYGLSLHVLATVWLVSTLFAWRTAVRGRFVEHEEWANRSYIATVAFVLQSSSYEIPFVARLGTFVEVAPTLIWLSWSIPMFVYDGLRISKERTAPGSRSRTLG